MMFGRHGPRTETLKDLETKTKILHCKKKPHKCSIMRMLSIESLKTNKKWSEVERMGLIKDEGIVGAITTIGETVVGENE